MRSRADRADMTRRSTERARTSVKAMCVRINSLIFAHAQLATLRGFVLGAWERLRIADETDARSGQRYALTLLRASDATLKLATREVCSHLGTRVCFVDTRERLLDELHAQPGGVKAGAFAEVLDELLGAALETVLAHIDEGPVRQQAILGICCGAASAYERVLLDGGERACVAPLRMHRVVLNNWTAVG